MIFIFHHLVMNKLVGASPDWIMHKLFPLVTRRTFKNWRKKPLRFTPGIREKLAAGMECFVRGSGTFFKNHLSALSDFDFPDEAMEALWALNLRNFQNNVLKGHYRDSIPEEAYLFPENSLVELEALERACFHLNARLLADDFEGALAMIRNELHDFPLFRKKYFGNHWPGNVSDQEYLKKGLGIATIESLFYVLALIDISMSRTEEGFLPEPCLSIYLPQWADEKWNSPMRAWFDQLRKCSKSDSLNVLSEKLAEGLELEFDEARRQLYRWRNGDPILPWDRVLKIIKVLKLDEFEAVGLLIQYGVANVLHNFHTQMVKDYLPQQDLSLMYAGYEDWYRHHVELAEKNTPVWQLPDEGGAGIKPTA